MADDVVTWVHSAFQRHLPEELVDGAVGGVADGPVGVLRLAGVERSVRPLDERVEILRRDAQHPEKDARRKPQCEIIEQIAGAPPIRDVADQLTADGANGILPIGDPRGRKEWVEDRAVPGVLGRVVFARDHHVVALEVRVREATA